MLLWHTLLPLLTSALLMPWLLSCCFCLSLGSSPGLGLGPAGSWEKGMRQLPPLCGGLRPPTDGALG